MRERLERARKIPPKKRPYFLSARDPVYAKKMGWPVDSGDIREDALLPCHRIVAFYGNLNSKKMGVLGEHEPKEMLRRFRKQVAAWERADPTRPVKPALQLIVSVAQGHPGPDGLYRKRMGKTMIEEVYRMAQEVDALLIVDVQLGRSDLGPELDYVAPYLRRNDVHLALDPEFAVGKRGVPGKRVGEMSAREINQASAFLARLTREHQLSPKVLIVHRFKKHMVTDAADILLRPEVQIVMHMDGWGPPAAKRDTYRDVIVSEPVEYAGFKIFYHHDKRGDGWRILKPRDVIKFHPPALYIQYQ